MTGAAFVGWDGTYSFNADGRRIPVERARGVRVPARAALGRSSSSRRPAAARSRIRATTCGSASTIWSSREEPVGLVTGTLALRGEEISGEIEVGVVAAGRHRHRPDRARPRQADRRADVPLPRQLARSVRPAVRAAAVAVHDRRRQRLDSRRRRAGRCRSTARRGDGRSALEMTLFDYAIRNARADPARARSARRPRRGPAARRRGHAAHRRRDRSRCTTSASRFARRATPTSASFRGSSATCAARAARC